MKSEWNRVQVGTLCSRVCSGGTPKSTDSEYYGGDIPWLNTREVNFNRISKTEGTITQTGLENSSAKWIKENCVIVAMYGATAGRCAITKIPLTTNQACCNLEIDETKADYRYVYYALKNEYVRLSSAANGGAQQNLNAQQVKEFDIPYPPLPIQRKIASILSALDDKIETNNAICRNLEEQARALYELWLSKRKNECEWLSLEAIADLNPEAYSIKEKWGYINYLDTGNITDGVISSIQKIDLEQDELPSRARRKVKAGDVVFSTVRPNQRHFGILHSPLPNMLVSTGFTVIRSNKTDISNELIYLLLSDSSFVEKMQQIGEQSVSAYPSVKPTDIATCQIPFMDSMDYFQMQNVICSMFSQIAALQSESRSLSQARDSLLPKLMRGELSVENIN